MGVSSVFFFGFVLFFPSTYCVSSIKFNNGEELMGRRGGADLNAGAG